MAEIQESGGGGGGKHSKKRAKKSSTRIDMTPMVDLAFLLLTFFILTSTFNKPKAMDLAFPAKPKPEDQIDKVKANGISILLGENGKVYWYPGALKPETVIEKTNFSNTGLRMIFTNGNSKIIKNMNVLRRDAQKWNYPQVFADSLFKLKSREIKSDKDALVVLIKADEKASYKNVIDVVDELNITDIGKFSIMDMTPEEKAKLDAVK
ncbi:MAG: biopolymer transporter ExbD [Bacteroidota bacterium]